MRMSRLPHHLAAVFSLAAVHLLLLSICPVSGRIYRTSDAIVIEVADTRDSQHWNGQPLAHFTRNNYGNPALIPMTYSLPNFPFWPYPLYKPASTFSDVENVTATSPGSRQQNIACGVGPATPPQRTTPTVGIIGGSEATPNSWPFIVGLRRAGVNIVFCGGSIISPTRILTAAHCVNELSAFDISTMTASLGMHVQGDGQTTSADAQMTRRVTRVVYHKDFNKKKFVNDVAVLTMEPPISYSKAISPVCLPPASSAADQFVDQQTAIIGWGQLSLGGLVPDNLQQATVQITSNAKCIATYSSSVPTFPISNQHICAGANGKDTCHGDSGGPMVVQTKAGSTAWTQVGVTSFGTSKCPGDSNQPSAYASVAFFRNWINTYMNS